MNGVNRLLQEAIRDRALHKKQILTWKRKRPSSLDQEFHQAHEAVFKEMDCLACANCCKTTSPIVLQEDMDRLAARLKINTGLFIQKYLEMDEDGDFVFTSAPCPFLGTDNYCSVYEDRPKACREYPHTNRKRMHEILDLTYKNSQICPAVHLILKKLQHL